MNYISEFISSSLSILPRSLRISCSFSLTHTLHLSLRSCLLTFTDTVVFAQSSEVIGLFITQHTLHGLQVTDSRVKNQRLNRFPSVALEAFINAHHYDPSVGERSVCSAERGQLQLRVSWHLCNVQLCHGSPVYCNDHSRSDHQTLQPTTRQSCVTKEERGIESSSLKHTCHIFQISFLD